MAQQEAQQIESKEQTIRGELTSLDYRFENSSGSSPGSGSYDKTSMITQLGIHGRSSLYKINHSETCEVNFREIVGSELLGKTITYEVKETKEITLFDEKSQNFLGEGKVRTERIEKITPDSSTLPTYVSRQVTQNSP